jgi:hypothetical protein
MRKCDLCSRMAVKRIVVGGYAALLCKSCCRKIKAEIEMKTPVIERTYSGPKASFLNKSEHEDTFRTMLPAVPNSLVCLWRYPHEEWGLAVSSGITDLTSYRELENRIQSAEEECKRQGRPVIVVEIGVQAMFNLLAAKRLENTVENRTHMIYVLGTEAYRRAAVEAR